MAQLFPNHCACQAENAHGNINSIPVGNICPVRVSLISKEPKGSTPPGESQAEVEKRTEMFSPATPKGRCRGFYFGSRLMESVKVIVIPLVVPTII